MADVEKDSQDKVKDAANVAAEKLNSDILILNSEIWPPVDLRLVRTISSRKRRASVVFVLVTEGGSSDSAFRMMRALQNRYKKITMVVPGWCKSAGTLMCIGAHEVQMGDLGEMGPIDVQIVKADEMDEQKSGLVTEAAFEKLQQEAFKLFMNFVRDMARTEYRITLKTAAEISRHMSVGLVAPIFEKMDPTTIAEDYRSNRLALAYAQRLNVEAQNLIIRPDFDALETLLTGYMSHGFVIDLAEAANLFRLAKPISAEILPIIDALEWDAIVPRNRRAGQNPRLEYLNDEPRAEEQGQHDPQVRPPANDPGNGMPGHGGQELPGNPGPGDGQAPVEVGQAVTF